MHIAPFLLCALVLTNGSFSLPVNETCDALAIRCETLQNKLGDLNQQLMVTEWPIADDKADQTARTEKVICRFMQESAQCLNALTQDCPRQPLSVSGNDQFMATWLTFNAKLCDSAAPVHNYIPALYYCYAENIDLQAQIPRLNPQSTYVQQSVNASTAQENACRALSDISAHMNGTAAAIAKKCGEEGRRILMDGTGYLRETNCPH
ncbi:uncharacterized protein LOC129582763 [Paramacrobiotus metropolitanus]|uniref:uncharacterized protein LOC129582763 n=1 Tax=Paramacrobiotus metropolitanus TaxID=2943436 RepID=UPI002445E01B|nr:uncharacterized protein LOC129582763 [Paramacrobiotus metropolitanus]